MMLPFKMAWKVTMVGIECNSAPFNIISRRSTPKIVLSRKKYFFASKMANCIIVNTVK